MGFIKTQLFMLSLLREQVSRTPNYLDPGTGSMILQVILGGVAGAAVAAKMFWHRIIAFIPSRSSDSSSDS